MLLLIVIFFTGVRLYCCLVCYSLKYQFLLNYYSGGHSHLYITNFGLSFVFTFLNVDPEKLWDLMRSARNYLTVSTHEIK